LGSALTLHAQAPDRRARIDIEQYTIEADISPNTQSMTAKATVRFTAIDDNVTSAAFELKQRAQRVTRGGREAASRFRRRAISRISLSG